ncbi:MAG: toprim domain-containing protein, partial [Blastomonas sp.]|nr:toprim domain-containing protein [Blastomonas sp.]
MRDASDLARRLARNAEGVCRHYLPQGRRQGRYWLIGDVEGSPGRSLFVRLSGPEIGKGAAGKWTDAATGEHGDLLDLIAANQRLSSLADTLEEARHFLSLPTPEPKTFKPLPPVPTGSPEAAQRLWAMSQPIHGTLADTYLRQRGITNLRDCGALRFNPNCWYRPDADDLPDTPSAFPALIAAVRNADAALTGVHRTWLDPDGNGKASVATPRRAMGNLLGNGVRFGRAGPVMIAGEGIETILSLRQIMPNLPMIAGLSAGHLSALDLAHQVRRLYIARDNDPAGRHAADTLAERAIEAGIEPLMLTASLGDLNDDLQR